VLVNSRSRSASVLLPWSMWAIMQKLRIFFNGERFYRTRRYGRFAPGCMFGYGPTRYCHCSATAR
jgi:hypothetical protein